MFTNFVTVRSSPIFEFARWESYRWICVVWVRNEVSREGAVAKDSYVLPIIPHLVMVS